MADKVSLKIELLAQGSGTGPARQMTKVIRDQEALSTLCSDWEIVVEQEVDFSEQMVLAAFLGQKSGGGYAVSFSDVEVGDGGICATIHVDSPALGSMTTTALTYPHCLAVVSASEKNIDFVWPK